MCQISKAPCKKSEIQELAKAKTLCSHNDHTGEKGNNMNKKPIDKEKKSNIKCEHCEYWTGLLWDEARCKLNSQPKQYYQRCKNFSWKETLLYK